MIADEHSASARHSARRREADDAVAVHGATLAQGDAIREADSRRDAVQLALSGKQAQVLAMQHELAEIEAVVARHAALTIELRGMEQRGSVAAKLAKTLKAQTDVMDTVPCQGHPLHNQCPLLAQAREASGRYATQIVEVTQLRTAYRAKHDEAKAMEPAMQRLSDARSAVASLQSQIAADNQELHRLTGLAAKRPLLTAAAAGLEKARSTLTALEQEETERRDRLNRSLLEVEGQLAAVQRELDGLSITDVTALIADLERRIVSEKEAIGSADGRIEAAIRHQSSLASELERLKADLAGLASLECRAQAISDEIARWKLLAKGLGNDGVIALSIDDAGPAITSIVNDLLLACYGPRFTIAIQTQTKLASGEARESFSIEVLDADNDSSKEFAVISGGQKVWINECLTRGIALYRGRDARQPFRTLFTDEADGPLDPERKRAFMRMKREVLRLGGYEREFFISQTPDLVDEADAVIDVTKLAVTA